MKNTVDNLKICVTRENTKMPMRSTLGSAGYDIFSNRKIILPAKKVVSIKLPFKFVGELDEKLEVRMFVRSSFGIKKKLRLVSKKEKNICYLTLNIKERSYVINVLNDGDKDLIIQKDEHFAQFVICEKPFNYKVMKIEYVPKEELLKYKVLKGDIVETEPNLYDFVLGEDLVLNPGEQKTFPTGLRALIDENNWTAITVHKELRDKLMLANQTAVIDRDYAFTDNYGHCFVGLVNLSKQELRIPEGTKLMSWWTEKFYVLKDEIKNNKKRQGGIGSTN